MRNYPIVPIENELRAFHKILRIGITLMCLGLVIVGTLWGQDDHFPFGPFRMYSTTAKLDHPARSTRLEAIRDDQTRFMLRDRGTGLRRAEIEGQISRFRTDPNLMGALAEAYAQRRPNAKPIVRIELIVRYYELKAGRPTGKETDKILVAWNRAGATQ